MTLTAQPFPTPLTSLPVTARDRRVAIGALTLSVLVFVVLVPFAASGMP